MVLKVTMVTTLPWLPGPYVGTWCTLYLYLCVQYEESNLMNILILRNTCLLFIEVYAGRKLCSMLYFLVFVLDLVLVRLLMFCEI